MKNNINIIIVGVSYFSSMASAMRVRNLFNSLSSKEYISISNIIITGYQIKNQFDKDSNNENIKYHIIPYNILNILSIINFIRRCFFTIKNLKQSNKSNILYVYGYPDLENIFIVLFAKIFNYKIIFDITEDNFTVTDFKSIKGKIRNFSSLLFIKKISSLANGVIVISSHLKEKLKNLSKQRIPIKLIPISVNFKNFDSIKLSDNDNIKLFYGGSFGEKDSVDLLLDAFDTIFGLYKNVYLIMSGKGSERDMVKFHKLLMTKKSKCNIIYKGFLKLEDYFNMLNECDIMCAIRSESAFANAGFPFKLGEYLASGKAVITSDVSDIKYYLKDNMNALIIRPNSKNDLVKAMELLILNRNFRVKIGEEGRKVAKNYFDNLIVTEKFLSFIEENVL